MRCAYVRCGSAELVPNMMGWDGMYGGSMMWGAGLIWLLVLVALVLAIASLIKYLRSSFAGHACHEGTSYPEHLQCRYNGPGGDRALESSRRVRFRAARHLTSRMSNQVGTRQISSFQKDQAMRRANVCHERISRDRRERRPPAMWRHPLIINSNSALRAVRLRIRCSISARRARAMRSAVVHS